MGLIDNLDIRSKTRIQGLASALSRSLWTQGGAESDLQSEPPAALSDPSSHSIASALAGTPEARTGGADDDEEAKVGLSANASVMGWLDVVESPIASPKERQIALKSLARFSSVPDDCEAIVEAGGIGMMLLVVSDVGSRIPFSTSSCFTSAAPSPMNSRGPSLELKRLPVLEQKSHGSTPMKAQIQAAISALALADERESNGGLERVPESRTAPQLEIPLGSMVPVAKENKIKTVKGPSGRPSLELKRGKSAPAPAEYAATVLANVALSSARHAEALLSEGAMMTLLSLMTCGETWAEKSAGHALVNLCTQIKQALDKQNQETVTRMLDAVAADACSGMHTMAQAVACESEACQRAAIMIASLTTSWTSFSDDQLDQLADAGAVRGLARYMKTAKDVDVPAAAALLGTLAKHLGQRREGAANAVPALVRMMQSDSTAAEGCRTLHRIIEGRPSDKSECMRIIAEGGVAKLVACLAPERVEAVQDAAAFTLGCLAQRCARSKQFIVAAKGIPALVQALNSTHLKVLTQALWALTSIIDGSSASIEALVSAQGLQAILQQLSKLSADVSGATPASPEARAALAAMFTTLAMLLSQHEGACVKLCDQGGAELLVRWLRANDSIANVQQAAGAAAALTAAARCSQYAADAIIAEGALPLLLKRAQIPSSNDSSKVPSQGGRFNTSDNPKNLRKESRAPQTPFEQPQRHAQQAQQEASAALSVLVKGHEDLVEILGFSSTSLTPLATPAAQPAPPAQNVKDAFGEQPLIASKSNTFGNSLLDKPGLSLLGANGRSSSGGFGALREKHSPALLSREAFAAFK